MQTRIEKTWTLSAEEVQAALIEYVEKHHRVATDPKPTHAGVVVSDDGDLLAGEVRGSFRD